MTQLNTPTASTPPTQPAQVLVLCGLVGSGKTTLAKAIQAQLPNWGRVNQDDLGSRRACEETVHSFLSRGMNVVLDRQNFDVDQRRGWLEIAARYPGITVNCAVMGTTTAECRERLLLRTNHPTIDNPTLALELLDKFGGLWVKPTPEEGFDHVVSLPSLPPQDQLTPDLLTALLDSVALSPLNPHASVQRQPRPRGAPAFHNRGYAAARPLVPNRFPPAPSSGAWGAPQAPVPSRREVQGQGPVGMGGQTWSASGEAGGAGYSWGGGGRTLGGGPAGP